MEREVSNERGMEHYYGNTSDPYRNSYSGPSYNSYGYNGEGGYQIKESKKSQSVRSWSNFRNDPEMKRKQRVASYKVFTVEGKVKTSVRNSFRWIKNKYLEMRYGWF